MPTVMAGVDTVQYIASMTSKNRRTVRKPSPSSYHGGTASAQYVQDNQAWIAACAQAGVDPISGPSSVEAYTGSTDASSSSGSSGSSYSSSSDSSSYGGSSGSDSGGGSSSE